MKYELFKTKKYLRFFSIILYLLLTLPVLGYAIAQGDVFKAYFYIPFILGNFFLIVISTPFYFLQYRTISTVERLEEIARDKKHDS